MISVQPLCPLCLCGYDVLTTETQRTQRLHREELEDRVSPIHDPLTEESI